jgi:hypothetical protein
MKMTSQTLRPLTLAAAAMALATPCLDAENYAAPPGGGFISQSADYENMVFQSGLSGISGAGVTVTASGDVTIRSGGTLGVATGAHLDIDGTLNVGQAGSSAILGVNSGGSIVAATLMHGSGGTGAISSVAIVDASLVVGTYNISGALPGSMLGIGVAGIIEATDFYWGALELRATPGGKLTFDNSHGDMGTVSLVILGSSILAEGQSYTIVESLTGDITGTFKDVPEGAILYGANTGQEFTVNYTSYEITLTAGAPIPEPSTYALFGGVGAVALVLASRWRRRQR